MVRRLDPERHTLVLLPGACAAGLEPEDRAGALRRVLTWYLHTARAAASGINPREERLPLDTPGDGVEPLAFADSDQAVRWYEAERQNLMAAVRAAEAAGLDRVAWQLPVVLRAAHMRLNPFDEWLAMGRIGLVAARRTRDRGAEAEVLETLGWACLRSHRLTEAAEHFEECLAARHGCCDLLGAAQAVNGLGLVRLRQRDLDAAESLFRRARAQLTELGSAAALSALENLATVFCERGDLARAEEHISEAIAEHGREDARGPRGNALRVLAVVQRERGRHEEALRTIERAMATVTAPVAEGYWLLELGAAQRANGLLGEALISYQRSAVVHRRLGDRAREARAWQGAGETYHAMERHEEAADFHRMAVRVQRELGDGWQLALALDGLARARADLGELEAARAHWGEARDALAAYADPRASGLRARIGGELERSP